MSPNRRIFSALACALVTGSFLACGGSDDDAGDDDDPTEDASQRPDATTSRPDATTPPDSGHDAATPHDAATADATTDASSVQDASNDAAVVTDAAVEVDAGPPTFTNVYASVLNGTCTNCHQAVNPTGALDLSNQENAYSHLVNVAAAGAACAASEETRVVPGNGDGSLLLQKLKGTQPCGERMPLGGLSLPAWKIQLVEDWVSAGASND